MTFAADTAVVRVGPGCFTAELHERWSSLVGIHGGYTAAIVANAVTAAVDDPSRALRSFATQFAAIPRPGPIDIEVTVERTGRSMSDLRWYQALALWKAAVFMEGNYKRSLAGTTDDPYLKLFDQGVPQLADAAHEITKLPAPQA